MLVEGLSDIVITWESQQIDYPSTGPDLPDYELAAAAWCSVFGTYSPTRIRYPYIRSQLLEFYRDAKKRNTDPVLAWREVVEDPQKSQAYKQARGKGGMVRVS